MHEGKVRLEVEIIWILPEQITADREGLLVGFQGLFLRADLRRDPADARVGAGDVPLQGWIIAMLFLKIEIVLQGGIEQFLPQRLKSGHTQQTAFADLR